MSGLVNRLLEKHYGLQDDDTIATPGAVYPRNPPSEPRLVPTDEPA